MSVNSMTGYGSAMVEVPAGEGAVQRYRVGVRSVNHRFLDVKVRLGRDLAPLDLRFTRRIKAALHRGHVEVWLDADPSQAALPSVQVDRALASQVHAAGEAIRDELGLEGSLSLDALLQLPDIVSVQRRRLEPDVVSDGLFDGLERALEALVAMRSGEGEKLAEDLRTRLVALTEFTQQVAEAAPRLVLERGERLRERVGALLGGPGKLDENRLAQEIAILADKSDVAEELTRLQSHLAQFETELSRDPGRGKKLEFLTQELLREVNTIGSKVGDSDVTLAVIDAKCELEKVREQVANLE